MQTFCEVRCLVLTRMWPYWRTITVGLVTALFALAAQQSRALSDEVSGRVIDGASGEGLVSVRVLLLPLQSEDIVAETETDATGNFAFPELTPGRYNVRAIKRGYLDLVPGNSSARTTTLPAPEAQRLVIALTPTGVITGRVVTATGQLVRNARATALVRRAGSEGTQLMPYGASVAVDDRGEYRLYGLPPGHYSVVVAAAGGHTDIAFAPVYFPDTHEPARAGFFFVEGGAERRGTDIVVPDAGLYCVQGIVTGLPEGTSPGRAAVTLLPASGVGLEFGTVQADAEGHFRFSRVPPGAYYVLALAPTLGRASFGPIPGPGAMRGIAGFEVALRDVGDVTVALRPGIELAGQVSLSGSDDAMGVCLRGGVVTLHSTNPIVPGPLVTAKVSSAGKFRFPRVFEGTYKIAFQADENRCSIKEATLGGSPLEGHAVVLEAGTKPQHLGLLLSVNTASIIGTVVNADGTALRNAFVFLVPGVLSRGGISESVQATSTNADGRFEFHHLASGQYVLAAVQSMHSTEFLDPVYWSQTQMDTVGVAVESDGLLGIVLRINQ